MPNRKTAAIYARLAGFMYLLILVLSIGSDFILADYRVSGDFAATAANVDGSATLYRIGLCLTLAASGAIVLLGGSLYVLTKQVSPHLALFALLWWVGEATLGAVFLIFMFVSLSLYEGGAAAFAIEQQSAIEAMFREARNVGFTVAVLYFSIGSALFFWLLFQGRFVPRWLAGYGIAASLTVTFLGFAGLIAPEFEASISQLWMSIFVAEALAGLWLLVRGADFRRWDAQLTGRIAQ